MYVDFWTRGFPSWSIWLFVALFLFSCGEQEIAEPLEIKKIGIACDSAEFSEIYINFAEDIYIPIVITYDTLQCTAKMRIRGDTSREKKKKSLKIIFDNPGIEGLPTVLNLNSEYRDITYMRQYISSELMKESGQACFNAEHMEVYMNDSFFGLYLQVENIGKEFLKRNGFSKKGNLYKATRDGTCLSPFDKIIKKWEKKTNKKGDFRHLKQLIDGLSATPDSAFYSYIKSNFEYDKLVNILAMNMLLSNGSTYSHNYYMYHDSYGSGLWQMIPWDMDKTLLHYSWEPYQYHRTSSNWISDNVLVERCFLDETIISDIKERIEELHEDVFNQENIKSKIDRLRPVLWNGVEKDSTDKIKLIDDWLNELLLEIDYVEEHYENIQDQSNKAPRPFKLENFSCSQTDTITFRWEKCEHPLEKEITYTLTYSKDFLLIKDTTVVVIPSDTMFKMNKILPEGRYYWMVRASDGKRWIDAFNTRSVFDVEYGTPLGSSISDDITLGLEGSPYLISDTLTVEEGITLEIEEGVEVHLREGSVILCNGNINAIGTANSPVKFIPDNRSKTWEHIEFSEMAKFGIFEHVVIHEGIFNARNTELYFDACTFQMDREKPNYRKNRPSIFWMLEGKLSLLNCDFLGNGHGEGMNIGQAETIIENCTFDFVPDAIELISVSKGRIYNNYIFNSPDDAIDFNSCNNVDVMHNYIMDCTDKGISIGKKPYGEPIVDITIEDNLLLRNAIGIAVKDSSNCDIRYNTILNNHIGVDAYVKREGFDYGGRATITHSIFRSNSTEDLRADESSTIKLKHSLADEKLGQEENIYGEAIFMDEEAGDYRLHPSSLGYKAGEKDFSIGAFRDGEPAVTISMAHIKSSEENNKGDWIEIKNRFTLPFDLSLYTIIVKREGKEKSFTFPKGSVLGSMESFFIVSNYDRYVQNSTDLSFVMAPLPRLTRQETSITLLNRNEEILDRVVYNEKDNLTNDITLDLREHHVFEDVDNTEMSQE